MLFIIVDKKNPKNIMDKVNKKKSVKVIGMGVFKNNSNLQISAVIIIIKGINVENINPITNQLTQCAELFRPIINKLYLNVIKLLR